MSRTLYDSYGRTPRGYARPRRGHDPFRRQGGGQHEDLRQALGSVRLYDNGYDRGHRRHYTAPRNHEHAVNGHDARLGCIVVPSRDPAGPPRPPWREPQGSGKRPRSEGVLEGGGPVDRRERPGTISSMAVHDSPTASQPEAESGKGTCHHGGRTPSPGRACCHGRRSLSPKPTGDRTRASSTATTSSGKQGAPKKRNKKAKPHYLEGKCDELKQIMERNREDVKSTIESAIADAVKKITSSIKKDSQQGYDPADNFRHEPHDSCPSQQQQTEGSSREKEQQEAMDLSKDGDEVSLSELSDPGCEEGPREEGQEKQATEARLDSEEFNLDSGSDTFYGSDLLTM